MEAHNAGHNPSALNPFWANNLSTELISEGCVFTLNFSANFLDYQKLDTCRTETGFSDYKRIILVASAIVNLLFLHLIYLEK